MTRYLFIDRDGTICYEPEDFQVDRIEKIKLLPGVIPSLLKLQDAGYKLIMISNQDGLGTASFPQEDFEKTHDYLMDILNSQGVQFDETLICPHLPDDGCFCRKPNLGLVQSFMKRTDWDRKNSAVIGDRETDITLAQRMGLDSFQIQGRDDSGKEIDWNYIASSLIDRDRKARVLRKTSETQIKIEVNLDKKEAPQVKTGIGFFDHMLEQIGKHGGFSLKIECDGDLHIDDHHSVEDVGLALGSCLAEALGDKRGIERYGFLLPMDETECQVSLDLSGRPYFVFEGDFQRPTVGELSTEMIPHFFRSLSESLKANLHIKAKGDNDHHIAEACFKSVARTLRQAIQRSKGEGLPSTKGVL